MTFQRDTATGKASAVHPMAGVHVTILMAVYNGQKLLPDQLDSIERQDHRDWTLIASDDGSSDGSAECLRAFGGRLNAGRVVLLDGPCRGHAENFMHALRQSPPSGDWIAFSDQDDVWAPQRLSRGIAALSRMPADVPALYCSRTWIADDDLRPRRLSPPRPRLPCFRNALVQNVAAGNTILMNRLAAGLVREAAREATEVVAHDWWIYQLVSGAGGTVVHDDTPTVLYRQHSANQIGANDGMLARIRRVRMILSGEYRRWNDVNIAALTASEHRLTEENRRVLHDFAMMRRVPLPQRWRAMRHLRLYRQTRISTAALWIAASLGRL